MGVAVRREVLEADVVIVGAGPAGLACAIRLAQLIRDHNEAGKQPPLGPEGVYVLEKAAELGLHTLSGAVMDPRALLELLRGAEQPQAPMGTQVSSEVILWLTRGHGYRLPYIPSFLRNGGNRVLSLGHLVGWLGSYAERLGINVITGTAGRSLLMEGDKVAGLYTDDKGIDKSGRRKTHFQPGSELRSRVVVLAEGARGSLTKQLTEHFKLDEGCNPQVYALGLKEIWEMPPGRLPAGTVVHTAGYPVRSDMYGGGWVYALDDRRVSLGLITGLHYRDPHFDPHAALQLLKLHPKIRPILGGGDLLCYGAKTIPIGGYWAIPRPYANGALIVGDSAGFFNSKRLKGIHLAMKSGMLAAESVYEALCRDDASENVLGRFSEKIAASWMHAELWAARNHHQPFERGLWPGLAHALLQSVTRGRGLRSRFASRAGHLSMRSPAGNPKHMVHGFEHDGMLTFDRLTSVYHSSVRHEEDQPVHLRIADMDICAGACAKEYGNPCQYFCPAGVYELVEENPGKRLHINAANCLHCKACDIMDPYQVISWVPPEGGGGPRYEGM